MDREQTGHARLLRVMARIVISAPMVCLLGLVWLTTEQAAVVRAAGPGYCVIPAQPEHAPTRPAIHLNHSEGPVGTRLDVNASDWHPGAHVALHFDGRDPQSGRLTVLIAEVAQGTVASDGTVTISSVEVSSYVCTDPSNAANSRYHFDTAGGTTAYFVLASDDGEVSAPTAFRFLPAPTVTINGNGPDSSQMKVGTTMTVAGSGWEPNEPLTITLRPGDASQPPMVPYARETRATADARGSFSAIYPLDARLPWNRNLLVMVEGISPRFGTYAVSGGIFLLPAVQPTFRVDHTLVTPGMALTVSGEHWYPGDTYTIKYCAAQLGSDGWENGPNCGKAVNPALGTATADAHGQIRQRFTIPTSEPPGIIMVRVNEVGSEISPIAVHVIDHLPTWEDIHPRVAALRNRVFASLPFSIPAVLVVGTVAFFGVRRWRGRRIGG